MNRYDIAIIGTGPAGVSAAITAKVRNKKILLFGSKKSSEKVYRAQEIRNYPGLPQISGEELAEQYQKQLQDIAAANGLLVTGGSDFHGFYNHYAIQIGSNCTPEESLNRIITHKGKA